MRVGLGVRRLWGSSVRAQGSGFRSIITTFPGFERHMSIDVRSTLPSVLRPVSFGHQVRRPRGPPVPRKSRCDQ